MLVEVLEALEVLKVLVEVLEALVEVLEILVEVLEVLIDVKTLVEVSKRKCVRKTY